MENGRFLHNDGDEDDNGTAVAIVRVKTVRPFILADMQAACASYFEDGWLAWESIGVYRGPPPMTCQERLLGAAWTISSLVKTSRSSPN